MRISIADSFLDAARSLAPSDARRASAFVEKLVVAPEASGFHPEIVREARNRTVRSFRVTQDMRAIAHVEGEQLILLFVARHDDAYAWARGHCVECIVNGEEIRVRLSRVAEDGSIGLVAVADARACAIESVEQLRTLFREHGIAAVHG
jgi:hypothetical protein